MNGIFIDQIMWMGFNKHEHYPEGLDEQFIIYLFWVFWGFLLGR
jgi:hypothetical protein